MAAWLPWLCVVLAGSTLYQVSLKLVSSKLPLSLYFMTCGLFLLLAGAVLSIFQPIRLDFSSKNLGALALIALVAVGTLTIDLGYFNMYKAGAPLSLSRALAATAFSVITLVVGVLFFKEHISLQQSIGIILSLVSIVLLTYKF